jgi:hypothetical protein
MSNRKDFKDLQKGDVFIMDNPMLQTTIYTSCYSSMHRRWIRIYPPMGALIWVDRYPRKRGTDGYPPITNLHWEGSCTSAGSAHWVADGGSCCLYHTDWEVVERNAPHPEVADKRYNDDRWTPERCQRAFLEEQEVEATVKDLLKRGKL